jgi:hypothetical protein
VVTKIQILEKPRQNYSGIQLIIERTSESGCALEDVNRSFCLLSSFQAKLTVGMAICISVPCTSTWVYHVLHDYIVGSTLANLCTLIRDEGVEKLSHSSIVIIFHFHRFEHSIFY